MRALLLTSPRRLALVDRASPALAPGQVRVRVRRVGICGSDYASIAGKLPFTRYPIVPGHEASGDVLESSVADWSVDDRVLVHPIFCDRADPAFARGEVHHSDSTEVLGVVSRDGAYAEEVVVEDYMLRRIDDDLDYEAAAMVEPVAVAARAVTEAGLQPGERVLVLGAGNIGQLVAQVARALGAGHVAVTDPTADRRKLAERLGANESFDPGEPRSIPPSTFDVVIDGVGVGESIRTAISACRRGGRIVVYGVPPGEITLGLKEAFVKDLRLITSRLYDSDFGLALDLVGGGRIRPLEIISHWIDLAEAPGLIESVFEQREAPLKVMITP